MNATLYTEGYFGLFAFIQNLCTNGGSCLNDINTLNNSYKLSCNWITSPTPQLSTFFSLYYTKKLINRLKKMSEANEFAAVTKAFSGLWVTSRT